MTSSMRLASIAAFAAVLCSAAPSAADFCVQLSGGLDGDAGFFRFKGKLPKKDDKIVALTGRVSGRGPAFGTAVVAEDGSYVEIAATFFPDGSQGQIDIFLDGPTFASGSGGANYGAYDVGPGVTAAVVDCKLEPSAPIVG